MALKSIRSIRNMEGGFSILAAFEEIASVRVMDAIMDEIIRLIAARYVEEKFAEIAAHLDQNAIANLAVAECAKKVAEEIRARPTVLREKTTINYNSIF